MQAKIDLFNRLEYLDATINKQFLIDNGFSEVPILKVDDEYLTFLTAVGWLNSIEVKK